MPRVLDPLGTAVLERERGEGFDAPVQAGSSRPARPPRRACGRHRRVPASAPPGDLAGLRRPLVPRPSAQAHHADPHEPHAAVGPALTGEELPAIPVDVVAPAAEPRERAEAREAGLLAALHAPEERLKRPVQPLQGHLPAVAVQCCERLVLTTKRGEFPALVRESERRALPRPRLAALLERGVVELLVESQGLHHRHVLARRRVQAVRHRAVHRAAPSSRCARPRPAPTRRNTRRGGADAPLRRAPRR